MYIHVAGVAIFAKKQRNCKNRHLLNALWFKIFWIDWFTQRLGTQNPGDIGQYLSFAQK